MNKAILKGRLGADPELKAVGQSQVCTFSLATSKRYKNKNGEQVDETQWHNIKSWGKQGEVMNQYLKKGDEVLIEGEIEYRQYEKDGQKTYFTEINVSAFHFCGGSTSSKNEIPS